MQLMTTAPGPHSVDYAVLLLGEALSMAIVIGGSIIVLGIAVAHLGPFLSRRRALREAPETGETIRLEGGVNFKGM